MATPMMKQYREIKAEHPDCILFFRLGDFYELFNEDAQVASQILGITLTKRNNGAAGETPLCGFPHHAAERYVPRMIQAGYKVAICEQLEDPKLAKGLVKRGVVEVITAGTALSSANLEAKTANYLGAIIAQDDGLFSLALLDVSTGVFKFSTAGENQIESELHRRLPAEILWNEATEMPTFLAEYVEHQGAQLSKLSPAEFSLETCSSALSQHFAVESVEALGLSETQLLVSGVALNYAQGQKQSDLSHITRLEHNNLSDYMTLDPATLRNLELIQPLNLGEEKSTLLGVLDSTVTAMGGRKLREWISHPLVNVESISQRQNCVAELHQDPILLAEIKEALRNILDIERLLGRVGSGRANARDLQGVAQSLAQAEILAMLLQNTTVDRFGFLAEELLLLQGKEQIINDTLLDEVPLTVREGNMIKPGADAELDKLNDSIKDSRQWLNNLEASERERLDIPNLKVGFNKVFGYYIEITNSYAEKVPEDYIRKQTLTSAERFITPEMKECEAKILNAESSIHAQEYQVFSELRDRVNSWRQELQSIANAIAEADVYYSLAQVARQRGYHRPEVSEQAGIEIRQGFHPVIAALNPQMNFIPNDVDLHNDFTRFMLITGPNMAGKSTYLRQTGLIVLMAQMGSFVPAQFAHIGVVDRIFTRVGASDRLSSGLSTFMVEMVEAANILRHATPRSLILLDEIGRGTSTFDGLAIAWAITEYLHDEIPRQAKTLFATHYHELTELVSELEHAQNFQVAVQEQGDKLLFLHKIKPGACDSSYGIHVAEMAGLPRDVVRRARKLLLRLEKHKIDPSDENTEVQSQAQTDLFAPPDENTQLLLAELKRIKPENMTPIEALNFLAEIKQNYC
ncbi:MAG: DNA mismatch repair protein MutS [Fibrobacter sp.]|nr:DNA mismatch repair protein MutS [Fibrobacter sp.]